MTILKELGVPAFFAEGRNPIDPSSWRLEVKGLLRETRSFRLEEIMALPQKTVDARLTSVSGWSVRADWTGVLFTEFVDDLSLDDRATHATFSSVGGYDSTLSLENLRKPKVMLCHGVGGKPLDYEYGGPLRLLVPHLWGYKSVKWLASIEFTDEMRGGFWEDRGYTRDAEIEPGVTFDINTRKKRSIRGGGEVTEF